MNTSAIAILMLTGLFLFNACETVCDPSKNDEAGGEFFSVIYETPGGENYLDNIYRDDKITVFVDRSGGADEVPEFDLIFPGYENGKFGPFRFTEEWEDPASGRVRVEEILQRAFAYDYYIRKDTFGVDTFRVEFRVGANECNYFWDYIRYYRNGEEIQNIPDDRRLELRYTE